MILFGYDNITVFSQTFSCQADSVGGTIFHMACHPVSIYPHMEGISGEWPAEAIHRISQELGGQSLFCRERPGMYVRGDATRRLFGRWQRVWLAADQHSARLEAGNLSTSQIVEGLPLNEAGKERTGLNEVQAEVPGDQVRYASAGYSSGGATD